MALGASTPPSPIPVRSSQEPAAPRPGFGHEPAEPQDRHERENKLPPEIHGALRLVGQICWQFYPDIISQTQPAEEGQGISGGQYDSAVISATPGIQKLNIHHPQPPSALGEHFTCLHPPGTVRSQWGTGRAQPPPCGRSALFLLIPSAAWGTMERAPSEGHQHPQDTLTPTPWVSLPGCWAPRTPCPTPSHHTG